MMGSKTVKR